MQSDGPLDHLAAQFDADARSIELYAGFAVAVVIPVPPVIAAVVDVTTNLECWPFSMPMAPFGYHGGPLLTSGFDLKTSMGRSGITVFFTFPKHTCDNVISLATRKCTLPIKYPQQTLYLATTHSSDHPHSAGTKVKVRVLLV